MPQLVRIREDLPPIRVPDGATPEQIRDVVQRSGLLSGSVPTAGRPIGQAPRGEFSRGVSAGVDSLQGALYGLAALVGDTAGDERLTQWGLDNYERNQQEAADVGPQVSSLSQIDDVGEFFDFASGALGQAVPSLASTVGTGGVGGFVGRSVAKRAVVRLAEKGIDKKAAEAAVTRALASETARKQIMTAVKRGTATGALTGSMGQQQGEFYAALREAGIDDAALPAWGFGAVAGALDIVPEFAIASKLTKQVVEKELSKSIARGIAKGAGQQAALEGATEGAQSALGAFARIASGGADWEAQDTQELLDSMAAGAIVGAVMGAPTEIAQRVRSKKSGQQAGGNQAAGEPQARRDNAARSASVRVPDGPRASAVQSSAPQETPASDKAQEPQIAAAKPAPPVADAPTAAAKPAPPVADAPTAEPEIDLEAQLRDVINTSNPRKGLYLSADNIAAHGFTPNQVPSGMAVIRNVDGKGGVMITKPHDANAFEKRVRQGESREKVIGEFTLSGSGKPVTENPVVVQQRTPEGAVTAETVVDRSQIADARTQLENGDRQTVVVTPEQALQRRAQILQSPERDGPTGELLVNKEATAAALAKLNATRQQFEARQRRLPVETEQGEFQFDIGDDLDGTADPGDEPDEFDPSANTESDNERLGLVRDSYPYTYIGIGGRRHGEKRVLSTAKQQAGEEVTVVARPFPPGREQAARDMAARLQEADPDAVYQAREVNASEASQAGLAGPGWYVSVFENDAVKTEYGYSPVSGGKGTPRQHALTFIQRAKDRWQRLSREQKAAEAFNKAAAARGDKTRKPVWGIMFQRMNADGTPAKTAQGNDHFVGMVVEDIVQLGHTLLKDHRTDALSTITALRRGLQELITFVDEDGSRYKVGNESPTARETWTDAKGIVRPKAGVRVSAAYSPYLVLRSEKQASAPSKPTMLLGQAHALAKKQSRITSNDGTTQEPDPGYSPASERFGVRQTYVPGERDPERPWQYITPPFQGIERGVDIAAAEARVEAIPVFERGRNSEVLPAGQDEDSFDQRVQVTGDTRGFESEGAQNEASTRTRAGRARDLYNATEVVESPPVVVAMQNPRLSRAIEGAVTELRRILKLKFNVVVTDQVDALTGSLRASGFHTVADKAHARATSEMEYVDADGRQHERWGFVYSGVGDTTFIYLNPKNSGNLGRVMRTLGHELGHVFFKSHWIKTDLGTRNEIYRAFDAFLEKNPDYRKDAGNYGKRLEEWIADQVSAWIATNKTPRTVVEQFFADIAAALKSAWEYIRQTYSLDETVQQFIQKTLTAGESEVAPELQSLGAANDPFQYDIETTPKEPNSRVKSVLAPFRAWKAKHPTVDKLLDGAGDAIMAMHNGLLASLQARFRRMNIPAFNQIISHFHLRPGQEGGFTYSAAVANRMRNFIGDYQKIVAELTQNLSREEAAKVKAAFMEELRQERELDSFSPPFRDAATKFRELMQRLYAYQREAHMPIAQVKFYFPQIADVDAMLQKGSVDEIFAAITESGVRWNTPNGEVDITREMVQEWISNYTNDVYAVEFDPGKLDDTEGNMRSPFQQALRTRQLPQEVRRVIASIKDSAGQSKYYNKDLDSVMYRYIREATRRSEYNRRFGDVTWDTDENLSQEEPRKFNAFHQFQQMMDDARKQGATADQQALMYDAMSAFMGQYHRITSEPLRKLTRSVAFYQNLRTLLLVTFSSLPEFATLFLRSGDFGQTWSTVRRTARDAFTKGSETSKLLRMYGFAVDELDALAFDEFKQARDYDNKLDRANEAWFRAVGLTKWTNFMRGLSMHVSHDYIKEHARRLAENPKDADSARRLAELGLSVEDVRVWSAAGEPVYGSVGVSLEDIRLGNKTYTPEQVAAAEKVTGAVTRMVNEMTIQPTAAMKPLWRSSEYASLVTQLGSFTYGFTNQVLARVWHELTRDGATTMQRAQVVASIALMLPLVALGLEIKELVQYKLWGKDAPTDDMAVPEYMVQLVSRAGLLGVAQLGVDATASAFSNKSPILAFAGPTIGQVSDLFTQPAYKMIPGSLPVVAQMPGIRDPLRAALK